MHAGKIKLVFMGTPEFAVPSLRALDEAGHEIVAVYTQPPRPAGRGQKEYPPPVYDYAKKHGLKTFTPVSLKEKTVQEEFAAHNADAAIVAAYGLLLPKPILEAYPLGCINIHPSLLPRWRGAAPIQRTIMAGDSTTGICIMQMDEGLDTGDVLAKEEFIIPKGTNAGELHDILAQKAPELLLKTLENLQKRIVSRIKQSENGVIYAKKITKIDTKIDWNHSAETIYHQVLGLAPSPGASFEFDGEIIKIFDAQFTPFPVPQKAGTVLNDRLEIACQPGVLTPTILQRPGKKRMPISEFLNGFSIPTGTIL